MAGVFWFRETLGWPACSCDLDPKRASARASGCFAFFEQSRAGVGTSSVSAMGNISTATWRTHRHRFSAAQTIADREGTRGQGRSGALNEKKDPHSPFRRETIGTNFSRYSADSSTPN